MLFGSTQNHMRCKSKIKDFQKFRFNTNSILNVILYLHFQKLKLKMFLIENCRNWSFSQLMNTIHPWYGFRRSCCFFQNIFESFPKKYVLVSLYMFGLVHIYVFFACCCIEFLARWCVSSQKILKNWK